MSVITGSVFTNGPTSSSPISDIGHLDPNTYYPLKGNYSNGLTHKLPAQMNRRDRRKFAAVSRSR